MLPVAVPQVLTERCEVDVVTVNPRQSCRDVQHGVDVVHVEVVAGGDVADYQVDHVHTEDDDLQAEQCDGTPFYLPIKYISLNEGVHFPFIFPSVIWVEI